MRNTLKFLLAMAVSLIAMLAFRALVFTVYAVEGQGLEPDFRAGDRVLVNRWSYGLRTGGGGLFGYDRFCRQSPRKGDYVAFEDTLGGVSIDRCTALPGDTVALPGHVRAVLPNRQDCAPADCYLLGPTNVVSEERIIGRAVMVLYSHQPGHPFWRSYISERFLLPR